MVSAGTSSRNRAIGSCTLVPARRSAAISTSGVSPRKSQPVLDMLLSKPWCAWLCRGAYPECVIVTTQSTTCQPHRPWARVTRTVSSTVRKNAYGIEPSSTSSRNSTPLPTGPGSTRSPTVARNGLPSPISSYAEPMPVGRSTQIVVVSRNVTARP